MSAPDPTPSPNLRQILAEVAAGRVAPDEAERQLRAGMVADLGFAVLDLQRRARRDRPEVVYAAGKTTEQVVAIARTMAARGENVIVTRAGADCLAALRAGWAAGDHVFDERCGFAHLVQRPVARRAGTVAVLAAGTSDMVVAEEAALTAEALGSPVERAYDVGVAGLHRLLARGDLLTRARVIVVVAGMEGALPSVVSGLVSAPVIAVPTSVGYGAHLGGIAALLTMINGCSPGVGVVNIDNGFGAGYLADSINSLGGDAV
jgi:NCAIR mutase (PurE)-related protein